MIKKILITLLILGFAGSVFGADCTVGSGKDETTIQACFDNNVLNNVGDEIIVDGGTYNEDVVWGTDDVGTTGNPVILRAATGETVIIDGTTTGLSIIDVSYVKVKDIQSNNNTDHGFYTRASTKNVTEIAFEGCSATGNTRGFYIASGGSSTLWYASTVTYDDCVGYSNGRFGFDTDAYTINGPVYTDCTAYLNGATGTGHGFSNHPLAGNFTSGWANESGTIYSHATGATGDLVQRVLDRTDLRVMTHDDGNFATLTDGEWDQEGSTLYINTGDDPNGNTITVKRVPQAGTQWIRCTSYSNYTFGAGEGHGFGFDNFSNGSMESCLSYNNEGAGVALRWNDDITIKNSILRDNALSGIRSTGYTDSLVITNNTIVDNTEHGISLPIVATNNTIQNNGFWGNTLYGMSGVAGLTGTVSYNGTYDNGSGATVNITNADAVTADPQLTGYRPQNVLVYDGGTSLGYFTDYYGISQTAPWIGAVGQRSQGLTGLLWGGRLGGLAP